MPKVTIEVDVDDSAIELSKVVVKEDGQAIEDAGLAAAYVTAAIHGFYRSLNTATLPVSTYLEHLRVGVEELAAVYKAPEAGEEPEINAFSLTEDAKDIASGDMVVCPACGEEHAAEGDDAGSPDGSRLPILVVRCPEDESGKKHLVAIMGKAVSKVE